MNRRPWTRPVRSIGRRLCPQWCLPVGVQRTPPDSPATRWPKGQPFPRQVIITLVPIEIAATDTCLIVIKLGVVTPHVHCIPAVITPRGCTGIARTGDDE